MAEASRERWTAAAMGVGLFALAATLRFAKLESGLRHLPDYDERIFVENALGMISRGDWDHRFYEYPGLLLWLLRIVLDVTGARGADAYLAARAVIALASALTVVLVFVVASRVVSRRAGSLVALLLAVSPLDVETAHMLRPDSVIAPLLFSSLALALRGDDRREILAWGLAAIATAIKFSAALVFVPLAAVAILGRRNPFHLAGLTSLALAAFAVLSPYTFLAGGSSIAGMTTQISYHYDRPSDFLAMVAGFLTEILPRGLSWPGLALVAWGLACGLKQRFRHWAAWFAFPAIWIAVFATSGARYGRFLVPVLGTLCLFAALGFEDLWKRVRIVAVALLAAALVLSSVATSAYLSALSTLTMDRALSWVAAAPDAKTVGSSIVDLGALSRGVPEVVPLPGFRGEASVASAYDALILLEGAEAPPGFILASRVGAESIHSGPGLAIYKALAPRRFVDVDLAGVQVRSSAQGRESNLLDEGVSTRWRSASSPAFVELTWPAPVSPSRLELFFGAQPPERDLEITVSDDGGLIETQPVRAPLERQGPSLEHSQAVVWSSRPTRVLRIDIAGPLPLRIGGLRISADSPR